MPHSNMYDSYGFEQSNIHQLRQKSNYVYSNKYFNSAIHPKHCFPSNIQSKNVDCNIYQFIKSVFCLFMILLILSANLFFRAQTSEIFTKLQSNIAHQQSPEEIKNGLEHILSEVLS